MREKQKSKQKTQIKKMQAKRRRKRQTNAKKTTKYEYTKINAQNYKIRQIKKQKSSERK